MDYVWWRKRTWKYLHWCLQIEKNDNVDQGVLDKYVLNDHEKGGNFAYWNETVQWMKNTFKQKIEYTKITPLKNKTTAILLQLLWKEIS